MTKGSLESYIRELKIVSPHPGGASEARGSAIHSPIKKESLYLEIEGIDRHNR